MQANPLSMCRRGDKKDSRDGPKLFCETKLDRSWSRDEVWHAHSSDLYAGCRRAAAGLLPADVRADRRGGKTRLRSSLGHRTSFRRLRRHVAAPADFSVGGGVQDIAHSFGRRRGRVAAARSVTACGKLRYGRRHIRRPLGFRHRQGKRTGGVPQVRRQSR